MHRLWGRESQCSGINKFRAGCASEHRHAVLVQEVHLLWRELGVWPCPGACSDKHRVISHHSSTTAMSCQNWYAPCSHDPAQFHSLPRLLHAPPATRAPQPLNPEP